MGARATRITREELLTPPEFRGLHLAEHQAARVGGARIELVRVGDETRLGTCYQQVPVRLMPPFVVRLRAGVVALPDQPHRRPDGRRRPSDRDHGAGGHAGRRDRPVGHPHPSGAWPATRPSNGPSTSRTTPAWSSCPARRSRSAAAATFSAGRVELAPRARLIWGDIWLPGRYDRGELSERFQFERIVQDFEVRRAGRLVYRDRFRWDGPWTAEEADWYFGGALASASLFVAGPMPESLPEAEPRTPALAVSARHRRELHAMVRSPGGRHGRPRPHRPATGRVLDHRARCAPLAPCLERPRPQPLVLDPGRSGTASRARRPARRRKPAAGRSYAVAPAGTLRRGIVPRRLHGSSECECTTATSRSSTTRPDHPGSRVSGLRREWPLIASFTTAALFLVFGPPLARRSLEPILAYVPRGLALRRHPALGLRDGAAWRKPCHQARGASRDADHDARGHRHRGHDDLGLHVQSSRGHFAVCSRRDVRGGDDRAQRPGRRLRSWSAGFVTTSRHTTFRGRICSWP